MKEHGSPEQTRLPRRRGQHAPGLVSLTKLPPRRRVRARIGGDQEFFQHSQPDPFAERLRGGPELASRITSRAGKPGRPRRGMGDPCAYEISTARNSALGAHRTGKSQPVRSNANAGGDFVSGRLAGIRSVQIQIVLTT